MKNLWSYIDSKNWSRESKYKAAFFILGFLSALFGFIVWLVVRNWALQTLDWMICFIGYPVFLSWLVIVFYSCRHSFHDNKESDKERRHH